MTLAAPSIALSPPGPQADANGPACAGELKLVRLAAALSVPALGGPLSWAEADLLRQAAALPAPPQHELDNVRQRILDGQDPLGEGLLTLRPPQVRRRVGAFYTPRVIVRLMVDWALAKEPRRVVDPGCGSGRFAAEVIRVSPGTEVIAIDADPLATLLTRAGFSVLKATRVTVLNADYLQVRLARSPGTTAFIGNPPYVRHHELSAEAKARALSLASELGYRVSGLAGLHTHFFLATAANASGADFGCFITSSEWLDVGYGEVIRQLLIDRLGGEALHSLHPSAVPFEAMTTAVITTFCVGRPVEGIEFREVKSTSELDLTRRGRCVAKSELRAESRWSQFLRRRLATNGVSAMPRRHPGEVPLATFVRVHRGAVTGANSFFVLTRDRAEQLGVLPWCRPAVTSAQEIIDAEGVVYDSTDRRLLLDLPADIDRQAFPALDAYLSTGEVSQAVSVPLASVAPEEQLPLAPWASLNRTLLLQQTRDGPPVCERYIARHRRPWWRVGAGPPAPILASYMARRPPAFALNPDGLAIINVVHGLYPVCNLTSEQLAALVSFLNGAREAFRGRGRTYHGGLEKFEPREMERLPVPADLFR